MFNTLPTLDYKDAICDAVDQNQIVILTAETGAGKSTQVPQYLAEHGYNRVIVTQPRILAARNLARRVREEWAERNSEDSSEIIGYRTAHERDDSGRTKILYCTDGLQLVRELTGVGTSEQQVLVLDEVHEWNENMEVLVAWAKKRCQEEPRFKVVIMSATIETDALGEYYGTDAIITVPGRYFEVKKRRGEDVLAELFKQLENPGHNILTFLPGKSEIQNIADVIAKKADEAGVPIIPLHSQLEAEMQQKAFASYPNGKIILATNIAQTSVTIDDIDLVIDSGLERRSEVRNGVEGLFIAQVSQADCAQRAGRAGRTKPGEYILAAYDTMPCLPLEERPEYAVPEIMRTLIDRLTLRLASIGIDIATLDFYHDPSKAAITRAKRTLMALGALTSQGDITNIGRAMERFPVQSSYARMLVEAEKISERAQSILAGIIAVQEVGGIVRGGANYVGWHTYVQHKQSDLLAQYDVLLAIPRIVPDMFETMGIIGKNIDKAEEVNERLHRDLGLEYSDELPEIEDEDVNDLMRSIVAGQIDQLWMQDERGNYEHVTTHAVRELSSSSVVRGARLVTGTPFDLQVPTRDGGFETLHLLQGVTTVDTAWLLELAPEQFDTRKSEVYYDPRLMCLARRQRVRFGKHVLEGKATPLLEDTKENQRLFVQEYARWAHSQLDKQERNLSRFHRNVPQVSIREVEQAVQQSLGGIVSLDQLTSDNKRKAIALSKLETYLGDDFMNHIGKPRHEHRHTEKRRRGWLPRHKRKHREDKW